MTQRFSWLLAILFIFSTVILSVLLYYYKQAITVIYDENTELRSEVSLLNEELIDLTAQLVSKNEQIVKLAQELGLSVDKIQELQDTNTDLNEQNHQHNDLL